MKQQRSVAYLSFKAGTPASGYWDQQFIDDLTSDFKNGDRACFIIPGAYQGHLVQEVAEFLYQYKKVLVFITSDEEGKFPVDKLIGTHPNMIIYSQYDTSKHVFPLGYTPKTREVLRDIGVVPKERDWFFSGQINHKRRELMAEQLQKMEGGVFVNTGGFAKGMQPWEYFHHLASSHAVICPPGNVTQDSFRVYETLEAGSIPIVDALTPDGRDTKYWERLFPDAPFPILRDYSELPALIEKCKDPKYANQVFAWWIRKKQELKNKLKKEMGIELDNTTVVMPSSPIPSHPDTRIIDETISTVRTHFKSDIIVTLDGVRPEQEDMRENYEKYIRKFLWKCNFEYEGVVPVIFDEHKHQSGMLKETLPMIKTPLMLYVEHDTPLTPDRDLELSFLKANLITGKASVIRFHFEEVIPEPHRHLMIGEPDDGLLKTVQWSQRPHLATTAFYRNAIQFFTPDANCFIEDLFYGRLIQAWDDEGIEGWKKWKLWIYHPEGGQIKRSYNLDGREGGQKFEAEQKW